MKVTVMALAATAMALSAAEANAGICCATEYVGKVVKTTANVTMFQVENVLLTPYVLFKTAEDTVGTVASTVWNPCRTAEEKFVSEKTKASRAKVSRNGRDLFVPKDKFNSACAVSSPQLLDYIIGAPIGLVVGPVKYGLRGVATGLSDGYNAGPCKAITTVFGAVPAAVYYGAVGVVEGAVKGTFVGGPWGLAGKRYVGQPFSVYVK